MRYFYNMYSGSDMMEPLEKAKFIIRNNTESGYLDAYNILMRESKKDSAEADYYLGLFLGNLNVAIPLELVFAL